MKFTLETEDERTTNIKVVGVWRRRRQCGQPHGRGRVEGVEFIAVNTDKQVLNISKADLTIQIALRARRVTAPAATLKWV